MVNFKIPMWHHWAQSWKEMCMISPHELVQPGFRHTVGYRRTLETWWGRFYIFLLSSPNFITLMSSFIPSYLSFCCLVIIAFTKFLKLWLFHLYFQISKHKVVHKPLVIFLMSVGSIMMSLFPLTLVIFTFSQFDQFCQGLSNFTNLFKELTFGFADPTLYLFSI